MTWTLVIFFVVNGNMSTVTIPNFKNETACVTAAALTISEAYNLDVKNHTFICLKQ